MIDEIGKEVGFLKKDIDRAYFLTGKLVKVYNGTMVIDFKGTIQVYDLDLILSIRELELK